MVESIGAGTNNTPRDSTRKSSNADETFGDGMFSPEQPSSFENKPLTGKPPRPSNAKKTTVVEDFSDDDSGEDSSEREELEERKNSDERVVVKQ
mmetsp:Transcript_13613/g.21301  ORF Transcript_13613/g.21301 Transcript_13613/m.21301 type:complete len:94 (-) Transcript_13613:832-1113(-)